MVKTKKMTVKSLADVVEDYAQAKEIAKTATKKVEFCKAVFKDDGRTIFKGRLHSVVRKESNYTTFDSAAFKEKFGEEEYKKYTRNGTRIEFVVVEND